MPVDRARQHRPIPSPCGRAEGPERVGDAPAIGQGAARPSGRNAHPRFRMIPSATIPDLSCPAKSIRAFTPVFEGYGTQ